MQNFGEEAENISNSNQHLLYRIKAKMSWKTDLLNSNQIMTQYDAFLLIYVFQVNFSEFFHTVFLL